MRACERRRSLGARRWRVRGSGRVDGEPGDERLAVVLSQGELDDATLQGAIAQTRRAPDVWVVTFVMPSSAQRSSARFWLHAMTSMPSALATGTIAPPR